MYLMEFTIFILFCLFIGVLCIYLKIEKQRKMRNDYLVKWKIKKKGGN